MAKYFFDVIDGHTPSEPVGVDLPDFTAVRRKAMKLLPEIAHSEIHRYERDAQTLAVVVRDETGQPVYMANLSYAGTWLRH